MNPPRITFWQIVEEARTRCAEESWAKARAASYLRHLARRHGHFRAARSLSALKLRCVDRARALAPERCRVSQTPGRFHLLSVTFQGEGSLHVPKRGGKPALAS